MGNDLIMARNKDFDSIRMEIINLLNSFDWRDQVIDNSEKIKSDAIDILEDQKNEAKILLDNYTEEGFTFNKIEAEGYLRGCITCLNSIKEYL